MLKSFVKTWKLVAVQLNKYKFLSTVKNGSSWGFVFTILSYNTMLKLQSRYTEKPLQGFSPLIVSVMTKKLPNVSEDDAQNKMSYKDLIITLPQLCKP